MNPREKTLIGIVGTILLLLAGRTVKNQYVGMIDGLDEQIRKKNDELARIEMDQERLKRGKLAWAEAGRQTLGTDESRAMTLFRPDIQALVSEVGFDHPQVQVESAPKFGKNGLRSLGCAVTVQGKLDDNLRFLFKLLEKPYMVRCNTLTMQRLLDKNVPKNTIRMLAKLDTLLLPADASKYMLPRVASVDLASQPATQPARGKYARLDDYQDIVKRKVFEPWTPPIPPPAKVVGHNPPNNGQLNIQDSQLRWSPAANAKSYKLFFGETSPPPEVTRIENVTNYRAPTIVVGRKYYWRVDSINSEGTTEGDVLCFTGFQPAPGATPPPPPPAPPADANFILARIVSSPRSQQAVLEDPANKAAEDKRIEVGSPFYGGTLIYVHPKGAVSEKDNQLRFHPLSKALRECVPLTEQSQPQLLFEVMKLEQRAAGISQGPG